MIPDAKKDWDEFSAPVNAEANGEVEACIPFPPPSPHDNPDTPGFKRSVRATVIERIKLALKAISKRNLTAFWSAELRDEVRLSVWAEKIYHSLAPGVADILAGKLPPPSELAEKLRSTHNLPFWGCYLKIGLRRSLVYRF